MLNPAEFRVWVDASRKRRSEDGFYVDPEAHYEDSYNILNGVSAGTEGVKISDFFTFMGRISEKWEGFKASE